LSPDGKQLYAVGRKSHPAPATPGPRQTVEESLGLQVVEVASGRKVAGIPSEATGVKITPDGAYLILEVRAGREGWTDVLDPTSLRRVARLERWEVVPGRRLDGQPIVLAS